MRSPLLITERGIEAVARFHCPARGVSQTLHFIIDTGSGLSFLGYKDAIQAGIEFDDLDQYGKPVAGFGGAADAKHLREACFIYLDFDGTLHTVEMNDGLLVYRPARTGTKRWKTEESVSLLGRDFLSLAACSLIVNLDRKEAYLEKQ